MNVSWCLKTFFFSFVLVCLVRRGPVTTTNSLCVCAKTSDSDAFMAYLVKL